MAGNNSIQILRGTEEKIQNSTEILLPGQPLYSTDKNLLRIGGGGQINQTNPINVRWDDVTNKPNIVTTDTDQTIAGIKTFTAAEIKMNNLRLQDGTNKYGSKLSFGDANDSYIYENIDGGLEIFASEGVSFKSTNIDADEVNATKVFTTGGFYDNGQRVYSPNNPVPNATTTSAGLMSSADKKKLDNLQKLYNHYITIIFRPNNTDMNCKICFNIISKGANEYDNLYSIYATMQNMMGDIKDFEFMINGYSDYDVIAGGALNRRRIFNLAIFRGKQDSQGFIFTDLTFEGVNIIDNNLTSYTISSNTEESTAYDSTIMSITDLVRTII